jgi:hypothetical protein
MAEVQKGFNKEQTQMIQVANRASTDSIPTGFAYLDTLRENMSTGDMVRFFAQMPKPSGGWKSHIFPRSSGWPFMSTAQLEGKGERVTHAR